MKRVLKWRVPVDDQPHPIGNGKVVLVDVQNSDPSTVYVWTEESSDTPPKVMAQVYGTGHPVPDDGSHRGSVQVELGYGVLVWHLYALLSRRSS